MSQRNIQAGDGRTCRTFRAVPIGLAVKIVERQLRGKIVKFRAIIPSLPAPLLKAAGEDVATQISSIQSVLGVARNKAGHALANKTFLMAVAARWLNAG